jgi:hypothetical protein
MADVTVKLTVGSFSTEVTGPTEYVDKKVEELVTRFLTSWKPTTGDPAASAVPLAAGGKRTSAGEFIKQAKAKSQSDVALLLGYYIEKINGIRNFTSTELSTFGKDEAKRPFSNVSDVIAKLTGRGLMMSSGDKEGHRSYSLTASGEEYVEAMMEPKK